MKHGGCHHQPSTISNWGITGEGRKFPWEIHGFPKMGDPILTMVVEKYYDDSMKCECWEIYRKMEIDEENEKRKLFEWDHFFNGRNMLKMHEYIMT